MTGPLDYGVLYAVDGEPGWRYVGQAWFVDDDGRRVEHDHVRMARGDAEVWVDPAQVSYVRQSVREVPLAG